MRILDQSPPVERDPPKPLGSPNAEKSIFSTTYSSSSSCRLRSVSLRLRWYSSSSASTTGECLPPLPRPKLPPRPEDQHRLKAARSNQQDKVEHNCKALDAKHSKNCFVIFLWLRISVTINDSDHHCSVFFYFIFCGNLLNRSLNGLLQILAINHQSQHATATMFNLSRGSDRLSSRNQTLTNPLIIGFHISNQG